MDRKVDRCQQAQRGEKGYSTQIGVAHVGAALYHQFVRRDGLLWRMWFNPDKEKPSSIDTVVV
jgi:hypothetical protein